MFEVAKRNERNWKLLASTTVLTGTLALLGCSDDSKEPKAVQSTQETAMKQTSAATKLVSASAVASEVTVTFDALEGTGSSIVEVYGGVGETTTDKKFNGTFPDGEEVGAICKIKGRVVNSDTSLGEEKRSSDEWIRIQGSPGIEQYATAVYVENPEEVLSKLPEC